MNRIIILLFLISLKSVAQVIPNAGFENWVNNNETSHTYLVPQNWVTYDMLETSFFGDTLNSVKRTTQSHSGLYAVLLQSATDSLGYTLGGQIYSCNSLSEVNKPFYGFPCSSRPASLEGYFKLSSVGGDVGFITLRFFKWNSISNKRDTLFAATYGTTITPSSYTQFSMPITYSTNEFPDTARLELGVQAIPSGFTHIGTQFYVDDLSFTGSVPFGVEHYNLNELISIYPNPSNGNLSITDSQTIDEIKVTDVLGQIVYEDKPNSQKLNLQIEKNGVYFIALTIKNKSITRKLIVHN